MTHVYVYYRIHDGTQVAANAAVARLFDAVRQSTGVTGALSQRVDDPLTWMESYSQVTDWMALESALADALTPSGLPAYLNGDRHVERFVACA